MINYRPNCQILLVSTLALAAMTLLPMCSPKKVDPDSLAVVGEVYTVVDQPPVPSGGTAALNEFLGKNIRYPAEAQKAKIQGKVIVGFVVTSTGRIAETQVVQSVGGGCDEEAVRVIKLMPNWNPGLKSGKPVNVRTSLPISFILL